MTRELRRSFDARSDVGRSALRSSSRRCMTALGAGALRVSTTSGAPQSQAMDAKDVLDIQVSVANLVDAQERFDAPLHDLGFARAAEWNP